MRLDSGADSIMNSDKEKFVLSQKQIVDGLQNPIMVGSETLTIVIRRRI